MPAPSQITLERLLQEPWNKPWGQELSECPVFKELARSSGDNKKAVFFEVLNWLEAFEKEDAKVRKSLGGSRHLLTVIELQSRLLRRKLPFTEEDILRLIQWICNYQYDNPIGYALQAVERHTEECGLSERVRSKLSCLLNVIVEKKLCNRIANILGEEDQQIIELDENEPWASLVLDNLHQLEGSDATAMRQLVLHACTASAGKPSAKWLKEAAAIIEEVDDELPRACLTVWIAAFCQPRAKPLNNHYMPTTVWSVAETNADLMKGLIWLASRYTDDELVRAISESGLSGQKKIPGVGPRSAKVSNAAVWALSQIDNPLAIGQLAILRSKITNKATQKVIDKAIRTVAERLQVPANEVEEMAIPAYGLTEVGMRSEQLGDFRCELVVASTTTVILRWIKPDGKPQKSVPKAVKDNFADELKELKAAAKDIQKMLPAQRDRIDLLQLKQKTWPYATWAERYLNHPLVGTLSRRLIWTFDEGKKVDATWLDGQLVDASGDAIKVGADATVSLWHPIGHDEASVVAWRRFFEDREIKQPFKQAHREVYLLTDAERNTGTYSNRYASHVIKQHQYNALCGIRGWKNSLRLCVDAEYPPTFIDLPEWNLRAEFWVEGIGEEYGVDTNDTGTYHYLATDQVRFYAIDTEQLSAHAGGGGYGWGGWREGAEPEPLPLDQVPALVLSEIMRDVDLFVGVASVGNDPTWQDGGPEGQHRDYWQDYSFGDLTATAETRYEILERLVPRLKIAERCSFDEKFLIVRGDLRTYKIHLGSSNILMEPNDQYLCIVPGRGAGPGDKVFLPFEGDQRLAVILSKAFLLADDKKIKDTTILSQIGCS